jgi:REP element-mobilizing transposase RayT
LARKIDGKRKTLPTLGRKNRWQAKNPTNLWQENFFATHFSYQA